MINKSVCSLLMIGALALISSSCVDTPSTGPAPPNYHALARFVNVAGDGTGGSVSVDGSPVTDLSFGSSSAYLDVLAGGRNLGFSGDVEKVNFRSNSQNTVLIHGLPGASRFLNVDEGYSFANNGSGNASLAQVKFVHVGYLSAPTISFLDGSETGTAIAPDVAYSTSTGYVNLSAGSHQVYVVSNGGYLATINSAQVAPNPTPSTTTGTASFDLTVADSTVYTVTVATALSDSLYTAAHFHVGLPGTNGPVIQPIDITGQVISFPDANLTGSEETPPDLSVTATAVGTFSFTKDGLSYSITTTPAGLDSPFVAGHFHNAPAGVPGPVVRTITSTPVGDTTLTGVWTSSDGQPLTPALISELLAGNIYVNFHSAAHPGGAVRAQLVPNPTTTNVFTGTWSGLTQDIKDTIVAGFIYLNFHNGRYPNSIVRGQMNVDSTRGQYGVSSLPATDFAGARMYTIVATGSGKSLELLQLSDRQAGVTKVSAPKGVISKK